MRITAIATALLVLVACEDGQKSGNRIEAEQTRELVAEAARQVGMPGITNFTEKRLVRQLYELRDQEIVTYSYVVDLNGRLFHICDSIGFGIPFSAQFSNPEVEVFRSPNGGFGALPQAEPNGLFPPTSSSATWVICAAPEGQFRPVYVEPTVMVSTFPLRSAGSYTKEP